VLNKISWKENGKWQFGEIIVDLIIFTIIGGLAIWIVY